MIGQYLSYKNEMLQYPKTKKFCELNKAQIRQAPTNRQHQPRSSAGPVASCEVITTPVRAPFSLPISPPLLPCTCSLPPLIPRMHAGAITARTQRSCSIDLFTINDGQLCSIDPCHPWWCSSESTQKQRGNVDCNSYRARQSGCCTLVLCWPAKYVRT